ncbi:MAG TPA: nucleotidyl transferase AbiEii/AbiGii toxin family protein [Bacteroidia bacterium]|nr:nucleotidyl transferase AbiEii/AbiGii toxin family protein [Bacteroidia bacterium]
MKKKKLHYNTITPILREALMVIMASPEFELFRLVGGTALSLQRGHRESIDIDMFTDASYRSIDFGRIDTFLRSKFTYVDSHDDNMDVGMGKSYFIGNSKMESIKLDVFYTNDEFIREPLVVDGIRMATTEEIVSMKIDVIQRTGRKKDFWDIHEVKDDFSLTQMLELHKEGHPYTHDAELIKKNMEEFSKADGDLDPVCLRNKKWGLIKLDIIDFAWTLAPIFLKDQRILIKLKANEPYRINAKEGIDYSNTELHFAYPDSLLGKTIMLKLRNNAGEIFTTPVLFDQRGGYSFLLQTNLEESISDYTFFYLEIISGENMQFEFRIKDVEGEFMGL